MSYKYLFDSSAWFEYFRGSAQGAPLKSIVEGGGVATSIIAVAELADLYERESSPISERLRFIENHAPILPITLPIALESAKIKKIQRRTHPKFGLADAIHYATAVQEGAVFVTADKDFSGLQHVLLI